jgi:hypothetical protein
MKMTSFWDIAPCSLVLRTGSIITLIMARYAPLKRRYTSMRLHGIISQKDAIFKRSYVPKLRF